MCGDIHRRMTIASRVVHTCQGRPERGLPTEALRASGAALCLTSDHFFHLCLTGDHDHDRYARYVPPLLSKDENAGRLCMPDDPCEPGWAHAYRLLPQEARRTGQRSWKFCT